MPWMPVKRNSERGGRIRRHARWTISRSSTTITATAHALSRPLSAVSKSIAANRRPRGGSRGEASGLIGEASILHRIPDDAIQRLDAVLPADLLAFLVVAAVVADGHLVNPAAARGTALDR